MIRFARARSGETCAHLEDGRYLHSRYSPRSEAERYFDSRRPSAPPAVVLILEPGCGYLTEIARREFPESKVIELHCRHEFSYRSAEAGGDRVWHPAGEHPLRQFLYATLDDWELANLHVLEWEPARRLFPGEYQELSSALSAFLRERNATLTTEGTFGPRWLNNVAVNLLRLPPLHTPRPVDAPVLIAAPGPSLADTLGLLCRHRRRYLLLSLSSALDPLLSAGLAPDGIIHTDPGYWTVHHLASAVRAEAAALYPLTARPYPDAGDPGAPPLPPSALLLSTGGSVEEYLLQRMGAPFLRIASHGSVSGSALYTAVRLSQGPVIFAGLDLSFRDIRAHVRGHSFDRLLLSSCRRYSPCTTLYYRRSSRSATEKGAAAGRALTAYADWFARMPVGRSIYTLSPQSSPGDLQTIDPDGLSALLPEHPPQPFWDSSPGHPRGDSPEEALQHLRERLEGELSELEEYAPAPPAEQIERRPLLSSFLAMADRAALLQLTRRQHLGGDPEEPWQQLTAAAEGQLERWRYIGGAS